KLNLDHPHLIETVPSKIHVSAPHKGSYDHTLVHFCDGIQGIAIASVQTTQNDLEEMRDRKWLIKNFSDSQIEEIKSIIETRPDEIAQLCQAIQRDNWDLDPIFAEENKNHFPKVALCAVLQNKLLVIDFASIMTYWTILKYHRKADILKYQILNKGLNTLNEETLALLSKTFFITNPQIASDLKDFQIDLLKKHHEMIKKYALLSPMHRELWVVKDLQSDLKISKHEDRDTNFHAMIHDKIPLRQAIQELLGINAYGKIEQTGLRIIPQISQVQIHLDILFAKRSIKIQPILGNATIHDLRENAFENGRICSLPFPLPNFENFERADGYVILQDYDMTHHDTVYHSRIVAAIPASHRRAFLLLADSIREVADSPEYASNLKFNSVAKRYYNRIIDMEFSEYLTKKPNHPKINFFWVLEHLIERMVISRYLSHLLLFQKRYLERDFSLLESSFIIDDLLTRNILPEIEFFKEKKVKDAIAEKFVRKLLMDGTNLEDPDHLLSNLPQIISFIMERKKNKFAPDLPHPNYIRLREAFDQLYYSEMKSHLWITAFLNALQKLNG
ncbi:MAG: hypothetical protein EBU93_01360, partial [Chlamydiae bacterium]|nr:hypothetical protein [Chlamydiota bacterium]